MGGGVSFGPGDPETLYRWSPYFLRLTTGFVFDEAREVEWAVEINIPLKYGPAFGLVPQVRLVKEKGSWAYYGVGGIPVFLTPYTLLGFEVGGGGIYYLYPDLGVTAGLTFDGFFLGNDLSDGFLLLTNLGLGLRFVF